MPERELSAREKTGMTTSTSSSLNPRKKAFVKIGNDEVVEQKMPEPQEGGLPKRLTKIKRLTL
jgi:hypothetical protein